MCVHRLFYLDDPKCKTVRLFAMDFNKAFDSVNHELLTYKLNDVPLNPFIINCYLSFLGNRQHCIICNSFQGQWKCVNSGHYTGQCEWSVLIQLFLLMIREISIDNHPALLNTRMTLLSLFPFGVMATVVRIWWISF